VLESDRLRIRDNVRGGFRGLVSFIQACGERSRPDIEGKITVASDAWEEGHGDLATSLLLDALIKLSEQELFPR
jgi:hypothetical protein